jgi:hypothetical protein
MKALSRPEGCLTDLMLDAWSSGELDAPQRARAIAHVATCERCRSRHEALEAERSVFYSAAPSFEAHAARFVAVRRTRPRPALRMFAFGGALAALGAAAAITLLTITPATTRFKGGPSLGYFVKRNERVVAGDRNAVLYPGDLVRFTYSAQQPRYLALFGRDARTTTVYYPSGASAVLVQSAHDVALDFSIELDGVLGDEQVHAIFCPDVFTLAPLRQALSDTGQLPVPNTCQKVSLTLHKVPRP